MKFHIITLGCAQNLSDSERIATVLFQLGFEQTRDQAQADLLLYNTCSIRQKAEDKILGLRREWQRMRQRNPRLLIGITGCMVAHGRYDLKAILPEVDLLFNIKELPALPTMLSQHLEIDPKALETSNYFDISPTSTCSYQGLVSIMTGCDKFCSYCIVPYTRGREVSRSPEAIQAETEKMIQSGVREIMLLGQNVDSYRYQTETGEIYTFADLLHLVAPTPGLKRLRYSSPYPTDMTDQVIEAVRDLPTVCEHIHLPLQAGSDAMLKAMNRRYTREQYTQLVEKIRKTIPGVAITTDIIVGFAGETEANFQDTLALYRKLEFDFAFIAMYSPRPGTAGAKLPDKVPATEKKRRWDALNELVGKYSHKNNQAYLGQRVEIMVEEIRNNGLGFGKTRTYKTVQVPLSTPATPEAPSSLQVGDLIEVEIESVTPWALAGEYIATIDPRPKI